MVKDNDVGLWDVTCLFGGISFLFKSLIYKSQANCDFLLIALTQK
uniref:Uncharacterized protein n=1 Tax=Rhizophora mucronata TaxID=61149 RepID=A0A2P2R588_RHIMU